MKHHLQHVRVGRAYINENASPQLQQIYRSGNLKSYMYRPDWFQALSRWKDYTLQTDYHVDDAVLRRDFPLSLQKEFFEQGKSAKIAQLIWMISEMINCVLIN